VIRVREVDWVTGELGNAVRCADVVLLAFGPQSPSDAPFCAALTGEMLAEMSRYSVNRIECVTGAMVGNYTGNRTRCFQKLAAWIQRRYPAIDGRSRPTRDIDSLERHESDKIETSTS